MPYLDLVGKSPRLAAELTRNFIVVLTPCFADPSSTVETEDHSKGLAP